MACVVASQGMINRRVRAVLGNSACLTFALLFGQAAAEPLCIGAGEFTSTTTVAFSNAGSTSVSDVMLDATLYSRPLIVLEESYWLGFQFQNTVIGAGEDQTSPAFYGTPFAIEIDKKSGAWIAEIVNAPLTAEDNEKLLALYRTIHALPLDLVSPSNTLEVLERDSVGKVLTRYSQPRPGTLQRSRARYESLSDEGSAVIQFAQIHRDVADIEEVACAMKRVDGLSRYTVGFVNDMSASSEQSFLLEPFASEGIPTNLRLAELDHDPRLWTMLDVAEVYPAAPRSPLESATLFVEALRALDLSEVDRELLKQLVFDNDVHLAALHEALLDDQFSSELEKELLFALGQADTANSHLLLSDVISDGNLGPVTRFGSIMALRQGTSRIERSVADSLLAFAQTHAIDEDGQMLADSTLMVLGTIASNTKDAGLESRIANALLAAPTERDAMIAMNALGNADSRIGAEIIAGYLDADSQALSIRAAETLGRINADQATEALRSGLGTEQRPEVESALLRSFGSKNLGEADLSVLFARTSAAEPLVVRRAAIQAVGEHAQTHASAKQHLREVMVTTRDRESIHAIMQALHGDND